MFVTADDGHPGIVYGWRLENDSKHPYDNRCSEDEEE